MIVQESDLLLSALDRRLQVDRVRMLDPLAPVARSDETPGRPGAAATATPPLAANLDAKAASAATIAARLPLGALVSARVVDVPQPDHVIAEIDTLRISLSWPKGNGAAPQPGRDIALRVLAHAPMLLFQSAVDETTGSRDALRPGDEAPRWSSDALRLQPGGVAAGTTERGSGPTRFDVPILEIEFVPVGKSPEQEILDPVEPRPNSLAPRVAATRDADVQHAQIALDDVIVARSTAVVDGIDAPLIARNTDDTPRVPTAFVPVVLQGPAWEGQPMELVVRRDREDDQFDNPVLDSWCGELTIDLPQLGRVAGHLAFSMQGLRIRLEADDARSVSAMTASAAELAHAFAGVNMRVAALTVGQVTPDTLRDGWRRG